MVNFDLTVTMNLGWRMGRGGYNPVATKFWETTRFLRGTFLKGEENFLNPG